MVKIGTTLLLLLLGLRVQSSRFGVQIHSWNDLREWPAMIRKGISSFKIDLHYITDSKLCNPKKLTTPCLILHHDLPPSSTLFYTAYDALDYLSEHHQSLPLRIALCTKYSGDKCDATYLATMQTFFDRITHYRAQKELLNVEFVLDQALEPTEECLKDRFRPWVSTLVPSRDPQAAISSNDGILGRFQIYNPGIGKFDAVEYLKLLASWDPPFGKFVNSSYPLQIWQPLDQKTIESIATYYSSLSFDKVLDFATNEDPLQKKLYLAPYDHSSPYQYIQLFKTEVKQFYLRRNWSQDHQQNLHIYVNSETQTLQGEKEFLQEKLAYSMMRSILTSFEDQEEQEIKPVSQQIQWEWKRTQGELCIESSQCITLPSLPNKGEKLIALDVSRAHIVAGVSDQHNVYLSSADSMKNWKLADKGSSVSISSQGDQTIMVVGDSYCWNCAEFNLHQDFPVCSQTPHSIESVMSYSYGPTSHFFDFIFTTQDDYISACNAEILHGALGTGYYPKVTLRGGSATVVFKGVGEFCGLREARVCGCSLAFSGLVLASFPLEYHSLN